MQIEINDVKRVIIEKSRWNVWVLIEKNDGTLFKRFISADSMYSDRDELFMCTEDEKDELDNEYRKKYGRL